MLKIFLINLDSRPDRLAYVSKQLDELGLDFIRISAVIGKDLNLEEQRLFDKRGFILEQKKELVLGEIGCAMSHRLIWQKMLDENIDHALILEDDVNIDEYLVDFLKKTIHYQEFDFLNLSFTKPYELNEQALHFLQQNGITERPKLWQSRKIWKKIESKNGFRIFKLYFFKKFTLCECDFAPSLGSGYIISKLGAEHFLQASNVMTFPIDLTWRFSAGLLRQGFVSNVLIEQCLDTDIKGRYVGYKLTPLQKLQRIFKKSRFLKRRIAVLKMYGLEKM